MSRGPSFGELLEPHVEGAALGRLTVYAETLERWAERHNLVRFRDRRELVDRHLVESLEGRRFVTGPGRLLDVGSGAGLPGVPLLAAVEGLQGVLLEPRTKRWAFLKRVVREMEIDAEVVRGRFEELPAQVARFDVVTCRAVAGMTALADWARPRLSAGGRLLLWTTDDGQGELEKLSGWRVLSCRLPSLESGRLVSMQPCFT
jgi:16S rRNA (guanine527-N7)-methyltransferase